MENKKNIVDISSYLNKKLQERLEEKSKSKPIYTQIVNATNKK